MLNVLAPREEQFNVLPSQSKAPAVKFQSFWVILGFTFWFGFYLGAIIMHAVSK
jgi:hypothetical protein